MRRHRVFFRPPPSRRPAAGSGQLIYQVSARQTFFVAVTGQGNGNFNWYALASGTGGQTGNYTLSTQLQSLTSLTTLSNNSIQNGTPQTITAGQTINGNIGSDGALVIGSTDVDMFKFVAPATETIDVRTNTSLEGSADTVLRVFDASGNQLAANDNIDSTTTASDVQIAVQMGQTYYIGVDGAGPNSMSYNPLTGANAGSGSTGTYALTVTATAPGFSVNSPAPVAVAFRASSLVFTVTLEPGTERHRPPSRAPATSDGTAIAGTDYTAESGTLTFPAGVTSESIHRSGAGEHTSSCLGGRSHVYIDAFQRHRRSHDHPHATATGTIQDAMISTLTFSAGKPATYTDSLGKRVQLVLTGPGAGTAVFVNSAADPSQITLANTTRQFHSFTVCGIRHAHRSATSIVQQLALLDQR